MVDLGAALNYTASSVPATTQNASNDLFSVSDAAPIADNRSVDLFGNAFQAQPAQTQSQPAAAPAGGGSFWGDAPAQQAPQQQQPDLFASFSAPAQAPAPVQTQAPQVDLFASLSNDYNPTPTNSSNPPPGAGRNIIMRVNGPFSCPLYSRQKQSVAERSEAKSGKRSFASKYLGLDF
jgi:hypothetical protein